MSFDGLTPGQRYQDLGAGFRTDFGVLIPPGSRVVAYVRSGGYVDGDDPEVSSLLVTTLDQGLAKCRAGRGDTVIVLPGHSENVTATACRLASLVDGTRIIGVGEGSNMPAFRWTTTDAQWVLDEKDVVISGLHLQIEGAVVVKGIAISGAGNCIRNCDIETASGAANKATIAIEIAAGAHRTKITSNGFRGTATHNSTDVVLIAGIANDVEVSRNLMVASATAASGLIRVAAVVALGLRIFGNRILNTMTASSAGIAFGAAAMTGICFDNYVGVLNDANPASGTGITFGAGVLVRAFQNFVSDEAVRSGVLAPAVVAT